MEKKQMGVAKHNGPPKGKDERKNVKGKKRIEKKRKEKKRKETKRKKEIRTVGRRRGGGRGWPSEVAWRISKGIHGDRTGETVESVCAALWRALTAPHRVLLVSAGSNKTTFAPHRVTQRRPE